MSVSQALRRLREILQELYPTEQSSRRVIDDAGIPSASIPFSTSANNNWHEILRQAHHRDKVLALVEVALADYDRNDLRDAAQAYRAVLSEPEPQATPGNSTPTPSVAPAPEVATYDLAIVTALQEELEPVLNLIGGRERWKEFALDNFIHYAGQFICRPHSFNVVACSLWAYGGDATTAQVIRLKQLRPRLLVMTGICAGWQEKDIHLGDLIVADRAFHGGQGKLTSAGLQHDIRTYQPPPWLLGLLKNFAHDKQWAGAITTARPHTLRFQAEWLLCQLATRGSTFPANDADWEEIKQNSIDYRRVRELLLKKKLITKAGAPAKQAEKLLTELRHQHYGQLAPNPDQPLPEVHYKAFSSSQAVVAVPDPFTELAAHVRGIGALEMEVASLLSAAMMIDVPAFAVKGVSDYGTPDKDDVFHTYAAEASARWMYAFICRNAAHLDQVLPRRQAPSAEAQSQPRAEPSSSPGGISISGNVGTVQSVNISGGTVGDIIGEVKNYGVAPAASGGAAVRLSSSRAQRCADLAASINETLDLIKQYDEQRRLADDPRAQLRAERNIADLRTQLEAYEREQRELGCTG